MKRCEEYAGIWLDHDKAYIVVIGQDQETWSYLASNAEGRFRLSGGSRSSTPYGPQDVASESKMKERRKHQLRRYYQNIIRSLNDVQGILIFGPAAAKRELEKEIKKSKQLSAKIMGMETTDKMTEKQIAAKIRTFFQAQTP